MKYVKEYGMLLLKFLGFLMGGSVVLSLFYYLLLPSKVTNIFMFSYMTIVFLVFGYARGKKIENRGFIEGLKIGFLFLILLLFFNLIIYQTEFKIIRIIYYMVLVFASVVGATIGINRKKE